MNERLYRLAAIVRADVLIRLRRPSTAVVFVLLSFLPYLWIPAPSTGRTLIDIGGHRALYNSAAIGMATAVLGTMFIGLAGFYVISNAVKRDVLSRCGFVIASTTMRGSEYILGKFAGNVVFLSLFTSGFMATSMAMVLVRAKRRSSRSSSRASTCCSCRPRSWPSPRWPSSSSARRCCAPSSATSSTSSSGWASWAPWPR